MGCTLPGHAARGRPGVRSRPRTLLSRTTPAIGATSGGLRFAPPPAAGAGYTGGTSSIVYPCREGTWAVVLSRNASIDFSTFPDSDGEPVAENWDNLIQMSNLIYAYRVYLAPRLRFAVGGNQFIYYDPDNGRRHVAPDVYVALDVAPGDRQKWQTWDEGGKFPDLVMEITSPSTQDEDLGARVALYGELGAREYYVYDPAQLLDPPLRAYRRAGGRLAEQPLAAGPDLAVYSPALGTQLRVVGRWLRLIDPATGEPVPVPEEDHEGRLAAEERARREEERARREEAARRAEEEARRAAEERERRLLRELAALRAELERRDDSPA